MRQSFIGLGDTVGLRGDGHVRSLLADGRGAFSVDEFSDDYTYRWRLSYAWGPPPFLVVIGMNPSTASCRRADPTVTRCARRAAALGLGGLEMVNLYGFISTLPTPMFELPEERRGGGLVGNQAILCAVDRSGGGPIVFAPGSDHRLRHRALEVELLLRGRGHPLQCLGTTQEGLPRHPTRVGYAVPVQPWSGSYAA
jgi:hypothetical protein